MRKLIILILLLGVMGMVGCGNETLISPSAVIVYENGVTHKKVPLSGDTKKIIHDKLNSRPDITNMKVNVKTEKYIHTASNKFLVDKNRITLIDDRGVRAWEISNIESRLDAFLVAKQNQTALNQAIIDSLYKLDFTIHDGEIYGQMRARVDKNIEALFPDGNSFPELVELMELCNEELPLFTRNQESLQTPNPFWAMQNKIIWELAERKTDEAAGFLVLLMEGDSFTGGEGALNIGHVITKCGEPCLPYLRKFKKESRKRFAEELIQFIERGEIWGP